MNATVTLPISELDTLRNDLEKYKSMYETLESKKMEITVTVREEYMSTNEKYGMYQGRDGKIGKGWYMEAGRAFRVINTEFKNLKEVQAEVKEELEQVYKNTIKHKDNTIGSILEEKSKIIAEYNKELESTKEAHKKEIEAITRDTTILGLKAETDREKEYHANTKKELELANDEIQFLYARHFWSRVFNVPYKHSDTTEIR